MKKIFSSLWDLNPLTNTLWGNIRRKPKKITVTHITACCWASDRLNRWLTTSHAPSHPLSAAVSATLSVISDTSDTAPLPATSADTGDGVAAPSISPSAGRMRPGSLSGCLCEGTIHHVASIRLDEYESVSVKRILWKINECSFQTNICRYPWRVIGKWFKRVCE